MKYLISYIVFSLCVINYNTKTNNKAVLKTNQNNKIICNSYSCEGTYEGPEFVNRDDIAHQFSNKMSRKVGNQLKALYAKGDYKKVDFHKVFMSTKGMGSGQVIYHLKIPFIKVEEKCDAYTSFDHVGGWNHSPELLKRKQALNAALMKGHKLDVSDLKSTPEGLQEYWIQWKNKTTQADCNN